MSEDGGIEVKIRLCLPLIATFLLAGCDLPRDGEQARTCRRILPALLPDSLIHVLGSKPGTEQPGLQIEYQVQRGTSQPALGAITCRFSATSLAQEEPELTAVLTPEGPLSDVNLLFLKRFYLATADAVASDPGGPAALVQIPEFPRFLAVVVQALIMSLPKSGIYALLSSAYALVFGLVGRINLAFGELAAVGSTAAIVGVALAPNFGATSPASGLIGAIICASFAGALYGLVGCTMTISKVRSSSSQPSLIATVGLSLFLMEYLHIVQSPAPVWLPPVWADTIYLARAGSYLVTVTPISLITSSVGLLVAFFIIRMLHATSFGLAWRAYSDDPKAAELLGVDSTRLIMKSFTIAGAVAGLSGFLIVVQFGTLGFSGGFYFGLKALVAAVVGGVGSVPGAFLGGIAISLFETVWSSYLPADLQDLALYLALVVMLVFRPGGFFGLSDKVPRPV